MEEAYSLRKRKAEMTESDMEAAQYLIELSEDSSSDNISGKRSRNCDEEQEVHQRVSEVRIANKIREIFGEEGVVSQPKKKRRYRSLMSIYMATAPISMLQR